MKTTLFFVYVFLVLSRFCFAAEDSSTALEALKQYGSSSDEEGFSSDEEEDCKPSAKRMRSDVSECPKFMSPQRQSSTRITLKPTPGGESQVTIIFFKP